MRCSFDAGGRLISLLNQGLMRRLSSHKQILLQWMGRFKSGVSPQALSLITLSWSGGRTAALWGGVKLLKQPIDGLFSTQEDHLIIRWWLKHLSSLTYREMTLMNMFVMPRHKRDRRKQYCSLSKDNSIGTLFPRFSCIVVALLLVWFVWLSEWANVTNTVFTSDPPKHSYLSKIWNFAWWQTNKRKFAFLPSYLSDEF